jgi:hypothetical protein
MSDTIDTITESVISANNIGDENPAPFLTRTDVLRDGGKSSLQVHIEINPDDFQDVRTYTQTCKEPGFEQDVKYDIDVHFTVMSAMERTGSCDTSSSNPTIRVSRYSRFSGETTSGADLRECYDL